MSNERRQFFRIDDNLAIAYRVLREEEIHADNASSQHMNLFSLLANYDVAIDNLLAQLHKTQPVVQEILSTMNKKLNCVINQLEAESRTVERLTHKVFEVNISACGLGFVVDDQLTPGSLLSLDLILHPTETHIHTHGKVVGADPVPEQKGEYVRIAFTHLSESDQETLIQHIVQRQGTILRAARDKPATPTAS